MAKVKYFGSPQAWSNTLSQAGLRYFGRRKILFITWHSKSCTAENQREKLFEYQASVELYAKDIEKKNLLTPNISNKSCSN